MNLGLAFFFTLYTKLEKFRKRDSKSVMTIEKFNVEIELSSRKSLRKEYLILISIVQSCVQNCCVKEA